MTRASTDRQTIRIGHSPDPDDAFMWYPLANFPDGSGPGGKTYTPRVDTGPYEFEHVLEDIQSLNDRSERGELEVTAVSIAQYPRIADKYALTSCGASMGEGYGPMVVAKEKFELRELIAPLTKPTPAKRNRPRIAIPGKATSAWLALRLRLAELGVDPGDPREVEVHVVPFDRIIPMVAEGEIECGLIIHEGQLTYEDVGLTCVEDLGKWWANTRKLPLPLGGNCIRRDLGEDAMRDITRILLDSIKYALDHRTESVEYALNYARDMGADLADRFVGMYVNDRTLDYGEDGKRAVRQFIKEGVDADLLPPCGEIDFIDPR